MLTNAAQRGPFRLTDSFLGSLSRSSLSNEWLTFSAKDRAISPPVLISFSRRSRRSRRGLSAMNSATATAPGHQEEDQDQGRRERVAMTRPRQVYAKQRLGHPPAEMPYAASSNSPAGHGRVDKRICGALAMGPEGRQSLAYLRTSAWWKPSQAGAPSGCQSAHSSGCGRLRCRWGCAPGSGSLGSVCEAEETKRERHGVL